MVTTIQLTWKMINRFKVLRIKKHLSPPPRSGPARVRLPPLPAISTQLAANNLQVPDFQRTIKICGLWVSSISWEEKTTGTTLFDSAPFGSKVEFSFILIWRKTKSCFFDNNSFLETQLKWLPALLAERIRVRLENQLVWESKTTDCAVASVCICDSTKKKNSAILFLGKQKIPEDILCFAFQKWFDYIFEKESFDRKGYPWTVRHKGNASNKELLQIDGFAALHTQILCVSHQQPTSKQSISKT